MKYHLTFFLILLFVNVNAQTDTQESLETKSYNSLLLLFNNTRDTAKAKQIARVYIEKSRKENDSNKMALGYVKMAQKSKRVFWAF